MKQTFKYLFLFLVGAVLYTLIELAYRGYSHISMFTLGGICFICLGLINEVLEWDTPLISQAVLGGIIITTLELIAGIVVNIILGLNVWDYSGLPFNILGQICLPFTIIWCFLSVIGILLDDYIRWKLLDEEKPRYKIF